MMGMEEKKTEDRRGELQPVNIPVQMFCAVDTTGKISPIWFRLETEEHCIESIRIEAVLSRDEIAYVGIREKRFICSILLQGARRILEIRYHVESQKWRIFRFLS